MLTKLFKITPFFLSSLGLQACLSDDDGQTLGYIFVERSTSQALTSSSGQQGEGSVFFSPDAESRYQIWKPLQADGNSFQLQNAATGKCLAISDESEEIESTKLKLAECEETPNQYWRSTKTSLDTHFVSLKGSGFYLGLSPLCPTLDDGQKLLEISEGDKRQCNMVAVVSASDATDFDVIQVELDDDPGGDDGTSSDDDYGGNGDPGGDDGTPTDNDPGGDDGTSTDDDSSDTDSGDPGDQMSVSSIVQFQ